MNANEVLDISKEAIWVLIKISLPVMLVAMIVGLVISLFQALTQIQEQTLSFVPKIISVFFALIILMPFLIDQLQTFNEFLMNKIVNP
jgi:flagellar biosynthetic protein FliQ